MRKPKSTTPSIFNKPPLHMDVQARNARLYKTLLDMGLFVEPASDESGGITYFIVSAGLVCHPPHAHG